MKKAPAITCLFVDIGGVPLANGWDHQARERAATHFKLERSHVQVAIASAKAAFQIYNEVFDSDRLRKPAGEGARTQTIDTIPVETLDDYRDHGDPKDRIEQEVAKARGVLDQLPELDKLMEALEKAVQRRGNPV